MTNKIIHPLPDAIKKAYTEQLGKRISDPTEMLTFAMTSMTTFIRKYVDAQFSSIFDILEPDYYRQVRDQIAHNEAMGREDELLKFQYSVSLKNYAEFLASKDFRILTKPKRQAKPKGKHVQKEREQTEGEKKHVEYEARHRNPALRQACIDKYGYQCQCCGMNFADLYGEELGGSFIEVHHLKMISTFDESRPEDYVENLVPLCSNCHSMIHHGKNGPLTLSELRAAYKGEKKKIKVWKED